MRDERLEDPIWVATELERRGGRVYVVGEKVPDDLSTLNRWARLGGAATGEILTARTINRGQLIELLEGAAR